MEAADPLPSVLLVEPNDGNESGSLSRSPSDSDFNRRSRRTSIAWVDFLTTPQDLSSDNECMGRRPSIPVYDYDEDEKVETVDDIIFNIFQDDKGEILVGKFLAGLENSGLKRSDQRLRELFQNLRRLHKDEETKHRGRGDFALSIETLRLDRETFKDVIFPNIIVISAAFRQQFVIPKFDIFCQYIEDIYLECKEMTSGFVPSGYIKQVARMDPNYWAVSLCTIDGQRFSVGDTNIPIPIHSCCKPFSYGVALNELSKDVVHKYVGQEPSGHTFNELVLDSNSRPHNPMINAGSIMIHAILQKLARNELGSWEKFDLMREYFLKMSGQEYIGFNNAVFLAKKEAADRNLALGHFMKEYNCFPPGTDINDAIDFYLQTTSLEATCEVFSVMASTLANGGMCPITGEIALKGDVVADVLSIMHSCGVFQYSGKFGFQVGLPAKSSIGGLILLVVPNVCGIALWSPRLDYFRNSVRGLAFCKKLVQVFNFHPYDSIKFTTHKIDPTKLSRDTKGSNVTSLLFSAASGDKDSIVRLHLSGIDMGLYDCDGRTALHLAACEGQYEVAEYLLRICGVNHRRKDRFGNTPYDDAVIFKQSRLEELLRTWSPDQRYTMLKKPNVGDSVNESQAQDQ